MPDNSEPASPLPDEYLREIGLISVRWNQLELVIQMCLVKLLGGDFEDVISHIPFVHMTLPHRLEVLRALVEEHAREGDAKFLQEYEAVEKLLNTAKRGRNNIIHAGWVALGQDKIHRMSMSAHGVFKYMSIRSSLGELRAITNSIIDAGDALYRLVVAAGESNISSPHTGQ